MEQQVFSLKRGRPTKYTKETPKRVMHYTKKCLQNDEFPTIEHLASYLGVGTRVLYDWEKEHSDFMQTMEMLRDAQRHLLISGGLSNKYNARFAAFLLKASHGLTDATPLVKATQNNTFNVSPDLLADALKIIEEKDKEQALAE